MNTNTHHSDIPARRCAARLLLMFFVLVTLWFVTADAAWACPTCKENLANSGPNAMNLIRGYFWSILFMMSMPFLILGGLGTYFYYEVRKARARKAQVASAADRSVAPGQAPAW